MTRRQRRSNSVPLIRGKTFHRRSANDLSARRAEDCLRSAVGSGQAPAVIKSKEALAHALEQRLNKGFLVGAARSRNLPSIGRGRHPPGDRPERFYTAYYAQQLQSVDGDLLQADPICTPRWQLVAGSGKAPACPAATGPPAAIDFPSGRALTAAIVQGGPEPRSGLAPLHSVTAAPCLQSWLRRVKGSRHGSLDSAPGRGCARGRPRGGDAGGARPNGPQDEGAVQTTGPLRRRRRQKAKPRQTALKKRAASKPAPAGRQITVHARPSYLTARHAGSRRHGRQRLRLQHVQPADADRGHLHGHARPGEDHRPARQRRARLDPVQVLSPARRSGTDQGGGNSASTATSNPGGSSRAAPSVSTRVSIASPTPRLW